MFRFYRASGAQAAHLSAVTSLTLLLTLVAAAPPAFAQSPEAAGATHEFTGGDASGWHAYSNAGTVSTSLQTGEFCATATGGDNPWDIAAQLDGVVFDRESRYTVSFDARATAPVTVPVQGGAGYPAVFAHSVELDGSAKSQRMEFSFSPNEWKTASENPESPLEDGWTEATGNIGFQLGGQKQPYTFCFDNFSLQKAPADQIVGGDFEDGQLSPFYVSGTGITGGVKDGAACAHLAGGTSNRWDQILGFNGISLNPGVSYKLSFDASSSNGRPVRVVIGDDAPPHTVLFEQNPTLSPEMASYSYTFTAESGFAASEGEDHGRGEVSFQMGGSPDGWSFCLDNVSFVSDAEPGEFTPDTGSRVRVNQLGYLPDGPKKATLVTEATKPLAWELVNERGLTVMTGKTTPAGIDKTAGLNVHEADFSAYNEKGTYTLVADGEKSYGFSIDADLYAQLRYDAINYFYPARSGIAIDGSIMVGQPDAQKFTRPAGHIGAPGDGSLNQGDRDVPCLTPATEGEYWMYGEWKCNYTADVVGGWYDAGDHGKYVVNGGIAVAQLLSTYERTLYAPTGTAKKLADGSLNIPAVESSNGVPDPLDEARWELEWMMKMQVPATATMYPGMVHHKVADADWTGLPLLPSNDPQKRYLHRPSTAATLNFAAVAAQGARLWEQYDQKFAAELLAAGKTAWNAAVATPDLYAPAPNADPSTGSGPYNDDNVLDEFYWAAAEMFLTTHEPAFRDYVTTSTYNTSDIWTAGGFNWFETAALGRMNLAVVESDIPGRTEIRQSVIAAAEKYLAWQQEQPFGTAYPGADGQYDWGSNSAILNNQVVMGTAFDLTSERKFADGVLESMDYLLGRNALNNSYITGYGHKYSKNQHSRWFANSLEPSLPNPPRGSVSGGPNSMTTTWDGVIKAAYNENHRCAPQFCYIDDIQSWSTNEITVNWNSALTWVSSFVADQTAGNKPTAGDVVWVDKHPTDVSAVTGQTVQFVASANGAPPPAVKWQQNVDGKWTDIPSAVSPTLTFPAALADNGRSYRALFSNQFGGFYTNAAVLTVQNKPAPTPVPTPTGSDQPTVAPSDALGEPPAREPAEASEDASDLATTGIGPHWIVLIVLASMVIFAGLVLLLSRRPRRG